MYSRDHWYKLIGFCMAAILVHATGFACRSEQSPKGPPTQAKVVATEGEFPKSGTSLYTDNTSELPERLPRTLPTTADVIARLRSELEEVYGHFGKRIRVRKALIYQLSRRGETDLAMLEFEAFLGDVEEQEGEARARLGGATVARQLWRRGQYRTSIAVYERLRGDLLSGHAAAEASLHIGLGHVKLDEHEKAADAFRRVVEEHDDSFLAPEAWKELAAAQLAMHRFDDARATLQVMARKYRGTEYEKYARQHQDVWDMAAEQRSSVAASLSSNSSSHDMAEVPRKGKSHK